MGPIRKMSQPAVQLAFFRVKEARSCQQGVLVTCCFAHRDRRYYGMPRDYLFYERPVSGQRVGFDVPRAGIIQMGICSE
jgi:hypothetical protein